MTNDNTKYLILDQVYGWREQVPAEAREGLALSAEGNRQLFGLPGRSSLLLNESLQEEFVCPSAVSIKSDGRVGVIDAATNRFSLVDIGLPLIEKFSTIGGKGSGSRNFLGPRGVALLKSGGIVVADTANHRVLIFSETQHALVQSWGAIDQTANPAPGNDRKSFRFPWAVAADECGAIFVVDRGNHRIQKISRDGAWLEEIGRNCLVDPIGIALGPKGLIAVVDPSQQAVLIFSPRRTLPRSITNIADVRSVTFGGDGTLFIGDANGLIEVYVPDPDPEKKEKYDSIGQGHSGVDGEIIDLAWVPGATPFLLAIIKENFNGLRQRLWRIEPAGTFKFTGRLTTTALDSKIEKCQWHRVLVNASIPSQLGQASGSLSAKGQLGAGSIEVESYTSDQNPEGFTPSEENWTRCLLSGDDNPDCLIQSGPGKFLWLRITLRSNGIGTPVVRSLKAFFPRVSYLQYLPAVYQEDQESRLFLDRFLSIFQTQFDNFDQQIDRVWQLFDPASVSESQFEWLAAWLALVVQPESLVEHTRLQCRRPSKCEPPSACRPQDDVQGPTKSKAHLTWSMETKRRMLKDAFSTYLRRGTPSGIEQQIKNYTDLPFARILEHFRLRRWSVLSVVPYEQKAHDPCALEEPPRKGQCGEKVQNYKITLPLDGTVRLWSRDFYKRLQLTSYSQIGSFLLTGVPEPVLEPLDWGAHRFTVFFPASPYNVAETQDKVAQVVDREKPAHTQAELCPVLPRLRVGVQATVGADAMVGGISHLVLNSLSTLNYDSILSCADDEKQFRVMGTTRRPRAGITATLS